MKILDISTQISFPAFTYLIEHIVKFKNNHVLYEILFKSIVISKFLPDFIFEILISYLEKNPTDPSAHSIFITGIDKILVPRNNIHQIAYNKTLEILESHPEDINAKKNVLNVGRWHFGKLRGGKVTIYDEQAIQNDIAVRSSR